jgi:flagellar motility protein MotE (MotC chaperone)
LLIALMIVMVPNAKSSLLSLGSHIPYVGKMLPPPKLSDAELLQQKNDQLAAAAEQKKQADLTKQKEDQKKLDDQKAKLADDQLKAKQAADAEQLKNAQLAIADRLKQATDAAAVYTSLKPNVAAPILESLPLEEAVYDMTEMSSADRAKIFASLTPQKAADITSLLKSPGSVTDSDLADMQQKVKTINDLIIKNQSADELAKTYAIMPPKNSAKLIVEILKTNPEKAYLIMKKIDVNSRAQILSTMSADPTMVSSATKISNNLLNQ